jgi:hypothetical protein
VTKAMNITAGVSYEHEDRFQLEVAKTSFSESHPTIYLIHLSSVISKHILLTTAMEGDTDAAAHKKTEEEERPEETKETEQLCQQMFGKMGAYLTSEMTGEKSLLPLSLSLSYTHTER